MNPKPRRYYFTPATHRHLDDFELWAFELATRSGDYDPTEVPALLARLDERSRR